MVIRISRLSMNTALRCRFQRLCIAMVLIAEPVFGQSSNMAVHIARTPTNLLISWVGRGTLQSSPGVNGPWVDELEASNPFSTKLTNSQRFFRSISRWSTRASLIASNSEMGVAELNGKIYVLGGYPASRVTVNTVQVYNPASNSWQLTTPMLAALNHHMPAVANGNCTSSAVKPMTVQRALPIPSRNLIRPLRIGLSKRPCRRPAAPVPRW